MIKKDTVLSQSDLNECNSGKRSSDVLIEALNKLEKQQKANQIKDYIMAILCVIIGMLLSEYITGFINGLMK